MARSISSQDSSRLASAAPPTYASDNEKTAGNDLARGGPGDSLRASFSAPKGQSVHRALKARHIQLIGIGGTIGTVLFVRTM